MCVYIYHLIISHYHRILEEVDSLPEYYCTTSVDLFGFSFRTSAALVNPCVLFMMYRYEFMCACMCIDKTFEWKNFCSFYSTAKILPQIITSFDNHYFVFQILLSLLWSSFP